MTEWDKVIELHHQAVELWEDAEYKWMVAEQYWSDVRELLEQARGRLDA